jgi:hypothetical protein
MNIFKRIHNFALCFLQDECEYSIKKLLAFVFSALAIYIAVFTTKESFFFESLSFVAVLLGLRVWERSKLNKTDTTSDTNKG